MFLQKLSIGPLRKGLICISQKSLRLSFSSVRIAKPHFRSCLTTSFHTGASSSTTGDEVDEDEEEDEPANYTFPLNDKNSKPPELRLQKWYERRYDMKADYVYTVKPPPTMGIDNRVKVGKSSDDTSNTNTSNNTDDSIPKDDKEPVVIVHLSGMFGTFKGTGTTEYLAKQAAAQAAINNLRSTSRWMYDRSEIPKRAPPVIQAKDITPKTKLTAWMLKHSGKAPVFNTKRQPQGCDKSEAFLSEIIVLDQVLTATGASRKESQHNLASLVLERLKESGMYSAEDDQLAMKLVTSKPKSIYDVNIE